MALGLIQGQVLYQPVGVHATNMQTATEILVPNNYSKEPLAYELSIHKKLEVSGVK